ncbi:MAG: bifunctional UDP-N-acetylmuramoyl-tripeptide:D-alanyl-D-alanine ligase/alanine racemase [Bacteroidota bacterium]
MIKSYSIAEIKDRVKGSFLTVADESYSVSHLLTDSRNTGFPESSVFFALTGVRNNGHKYLSELYALGVRCFVVSEDTFSKKDFPEANIVLVKNTLTALQLLAAEHRKSFTIPVIGVTGSNGKTIVKEWIFQLLHDDKRIVRSPKSYNSQVGVPLSVWQMNEDDQLAVFEAGISEQDEMEKLQNVIRPTIGIFTNIGQAHDENFINVGQKIGEKLKLFSHVETLIYCGDYFPIRERLIKSEVLKNIKTFTWATHPEADLFITETVREDRRSILHGRYKNNVVSITIPFTDNASVENATQCWALMLVLGYDQETIARRMLQLTPVAMRLELKEGINNTSLINDYYNSDMNSLSIALDFLNQQRQHAQKTVVLSDILESGRNDRELYSTVSDLLEQKGVRRIIGIGPAISRMSFIFKTVEKEFFLSTEDFLKAYHDAYFSNETILLKGARKFAFEQISRLLQQKTHETVLEINLNALVHNLNYFRSLCGPEVKIMAMVKAFSYGSGSFEIANLLQFNHIDYLAVAYADEGSELRRNGITVPVMVMNPDEQSFDSMIRNNLEPEIYSFRMLNLLADFLTINERYIQKALPIHLKIDTGMHRLGFDPAETDQLISRLKEVPNIQIASVFSHLAGSDDPAMDDFTRKQIETLNKCVKTIRKHFQDPFLVHILNTSGILRFPEARPDMVRPGLGLYGVTSDKAHTKNLMHVSRLKTIISQIRNVKAGDCIGYGQTGKVEKDMCIATLPIGYADGIPRILGNGKGKVFIHGKTAYTVGSICMDMCMVDISDIDAKEGDDAYLFDSVHPITEIAKDMGTIPYEVLAALSARIKRVYYHE